MDITEKRFERDIESYLISPAGGYQQFCGQDADGNWIHARQLDASRCIYLDVLVSFIRKTQPRQWARYEKYYGVNAPEKLYNRLEKTISEQGLIYVLRNGIDDLGVKLKVCYFKPESKLNDDTLAQYDANILGCSRQFRYSLSNSNSIDMALSLNGIPIVALELKNQLTGQDCSNAINQYKTDRDPKEFCFRLNHRFLVYFAVDLKEAWTTTRLKGDETRFMPFNQGSNGPGVSGGAGNPNVKDGYDTAYIWERVLQKDSLLELVHRFITFVKEKKEIANGSTTKTLTEEKILFPRFHQYDVVEKVVDDVRRRGAGSNYLIEHSAGSGKSNSIAWIAYRLASLQDENDNPVFNTVIVVTNRIVLDNQLQDTINSFDHDAALVEAIDDKKHSSNLATALNNKKRIIICTIQKFLFAYKDMEKFTGRKFAIIVDEAHQGQSGESSKTLRRSLIDIGVAIKEFADAEGIDEDEVDLTSEYFNTVIGQGKHENQSFFAFTATPKSSTLELFGTPDPVSGDNIPFHTYSMRQAIEEGFILDVLANYCTIKEAFKLVKVTADDPELAEGPAYKALVKYYKQHGFTIAQKTEMIMTNFLSNCRYQIGGKGKAMVVADSRVNAVRYYLAIKEYIKNHESETVGTRPCVAFSGEVRLSNQVFTEASMNTDADGNFITTDKKFRKAFRSDRFNIMVVANKYQTGFDEPLLHSMYVDKKLLDVTAVQTLSRLNRTCKDKSSTFVLDFENTVEDIKNAFAPFFDTTMLEGSTDLNKVYDIRNKIKEFMLYNHDDVEHMNRFMKENSARKQDPGVLGRLSSLLKPVIDRFNNLDEDERFTARDYIIRFNKAYSYVTQLIRLHDEDLFQEYLYTIQLIKLLPRNSVDIVDIDNKVKLEYASLEETYHGAITVGEQAPVLTPSKGTAPKRQDKKTDTLQSIIDKINDRFEGNFSEGDRVIVEGIFQRFMNDPDVKKFKKYAKTNSTEMFVNSLFPDKFKEIVTECFMENNNSFDKLFNDTDFYQQVMSSMANELYKCLRTEKQES